MASRQKSFLSKMEYITEHRTEALAHHLDRYLRWGFSNAEDDERFEKVAIQTSTEHDPDMREYVGHQTTADTEHLRSGRQVEHGVERDLITSVSRNKFNMSDVSKKFKSDSNSTRDSIIRITVAELPVNPNHEPGSMFPKDQAEKIKGMIEKEVKHEVDEYITDLDVDVRVVPSASKMIGKLSFHGEPINAKYLFATYVVSFRWKDPVQLNVSKDQLNYQHKVGKRTALTNSALTAIGYDINDLARQFNMSASDFINLIDGYL